MCVSVYRAQGPAVSLLMDKTDKTWWYIDLTRGKIQSGLDKDMEIEMKHKNEEMNKPSAAKQLELHFIQ